MWLDGYEWWVGGNRFWYIVNYSTGIRVEMSETMNNHDVAGLFVSLFKDAV
jgi:hypothetical protein